MTKAPGWHGLVTWDTLFNSLSTGLFLAAAVCELARAEVFAPVARLAYPVALAFLLADLVCLVLDLGDPLRFHHMLRVFKPGSPMSLGVWSLTAYALPLTAAAALGLVPGDDAALDGARRAAVIVGLVPALTAAVYKGVLFSTTAQPGWSGARWLGGYFTSSGLVLGCGELLALSVLAGHERAAVILRPALALLLVLSLVPLGLLLAEFRAGLPGGRARQRLRHTAALAVVVGVLVPLALVLLSGESLVLLGAVALNLVEGLLTRSFIVRLPHLPA
jgi:Ni/Fe-hydrogenase subunit HybB-like protein